MDKMIIYRRLGVGFVVCGLIFGLTSCSGRKEAKVQMKRDRMIVDKLHNAESYYDMHPAFEKAFAFLRQDGLAGLPPVRYEIDGDRLFCMISKGHGRSRSEAKLEAHRRYIDIQYVIAGTDEMGFRPWANCISVDTSYDFDKDIEFFKDRPVRWTPVPPGSFVIFFPQHAHAPLVSSGEIHKAVLKISVDY